MVVLRFCFGVVGEGFTEGLGFRNVNPKTLNSTWLSAGWLLGLEPFGLLKKLQEGAQKSKLLGFRV